MTNSISLIDRSQAWNGSLCRVAVTDLGEFAPAIIIRGRGLLGCVAALHNCHPPARNESDCYSVTFWVRPISQRGCHIYQFWLFNKMTFSSLFYIRKIHFLHTQKVHTCHPSRRFKQATRQLRAIYDENFICRFLKMTLSGVSDFTLSWFPNQWTDFDNVCVILMRIQCYLCGRNLKIAESIQVTHFRR